MINKTDCDEWLMQQVAQGKRQYLDLLVRRHANALLTFVTRMVGDHHRGEELFQEVFLAVWVKRGTYEFPRPFRSWLFGIAANKCRVEFRSRRAAQILSLELAAAESPASGEPTPLDTALATETTSLVQAAVAGLPTQQRTVVALRIWEGMSYTDIAETLGRTEATVRSNMHHGLNALRKALEPHQNL